jgi:hypothetical protein
MLCSGVSEMLDWRQDVNEAREDVEEMVKK